MKLCPKCNVEKPLGGFHKSSREPCGLQSHCKECRAESATKAASKRRDYFRRYYASHREEIVERAIDWQKDNAQRQRLTRRRYRARNYAPPHATPAWANKFFIEEIYELACLRSQMTGITWSVDHIVPLNSPIVCGLHVENNLRVIPMVENSTKCNRYWPDMPEPDKGAT